MEPNQEENKESQEGKGEKFFKEFGKRMDLFMIELKDAGNRAQIDLQKKFEELKKAGDNFKTEASSKDRWKEVETSLKKAGDELESAFKAAFKKK